MHGQLSKTMLIFLLISGVLVSFSASARSFSVLGGVAKDAELTGKVVDRTSNSPIKGALLFLDENPEITAVTDSKGAFVLKVNDQLLSSLNYTITLEVEARNYQAKQIEVTFEPGKDKGLGTIKLKPNNSGGLAPSMSSDRNIALIGILLDESSRQPVKGEVSFNITIPGSTDVSFDESGIFTITIPESRFLEAEGKFSLSINADGYGTNITQVSFSPGRQFYDFGVLTLDPNAEFVPETFTPTEADKGVDFRPQPETFTPTEADKGVDFRPVVVRTDDDALYDIQTAYNQLKQTELGTDFKDPEGLALLEQLFDQYEQDVSKNHLQTLADNRREKYHRVLTGMENYRDEYLARSARMLRHNLEGYDLDYLKSDEFESIMTGLGETLSYLRQFFKAENGPDASVKIEEIDDYLFIINKYFNL
ncbi:MAG: hypothetical protein AAFV80_02070 [Bacteroidota bacterium]